MTVKFFKKKVIKWCLKNKIWKSFLMIIIVEFYSIITPYALRCAFMFLFNIDFVLSSTLISPIGKPAEYILSCSRLAYSFKQRILKCICCGLYLLFLWLSCIYVDLPKWLDKHVHPLAFLSTISLAACFELHFRSNVPRLVTHLI